MDSPEIIELTQLSGSQALDALVHVIEKTLSVEIEGQRIEHIGAIEHRGPSQDVVVSARSLGRQMILSFNPEDEPVIHYKLLILGK